MKKLICAVCLAIGLVASAFASDDGVTLINVFEVPAGKLDDSIAMWEQARDFLKTQPGYRSTALHQSVSADTTYQLINIAHWDSPQAFLAATKKMQAEAGLPQIEGLKSIPGLYTVIRE